MASGIDFPLVGEGLKQLQSFLGIGRHTPLWDAILVSFDLEPKKDGSASGAMFGIHEIGVSTFDTRSVSLSTSASSLMTRHFVVGGNKKLSRGARNFHFGASEHADQNNIKEVILKLLYIRDGIEDFPKPRYRNVVLVGHGLRSDLLILRKHGIMFEEISTIVAKLDTTYMAMEVLGMNFRLQSLLDILRCPNQNLYNAGNDANFTLRALLLLAYYGLRPSASLSNAEKLASLKNLAMEPIPDTTERNAILRAMKFRCEDWTLNALDIGAISFFDEV
ncbi:hypothetical protein N431DRAFT_237456 [Stipitochalara longipes BDJ]|nr:hypothetical protein N431DRAFT_237456 [Stipitochalara longipes BDJ]